MPNWLLLATAMTLGAAGSGVTWWLWSVAAAAPGVAASLRIDAIRTGVGAVVSTGGAFALLLALRRQRSTAISARNTLTHADERWITELYTKAAGQLGSDSAAVRLAGLYALERLAQDSPGQRQTIVNVICAYLQIPCAPADGERGEAVERAQEHRVRTAAQNILRRHLWRTAAEQLRWRVAVDLSGASLVHARLMAVSLRAAGLRGADLTEARLDGSDLTRAELTGAKLNRAVLCRADLTEADFGEADLSGADLRSAILDGADLSSVVGLTQDQLAASVGDWRTRLPTHARRPVSWRTARSSWRRRDGQSPPRDHGRNSAADGGRPARS